MLLVLASSAYAAARRGFVAVLFSFLGFVVALIVAFSTYVVVGEFLARQFGWSLVWTKPLSFVGIWTLVEMLFALVEGVLLSRTLAGLNASPVSRALAVIPGIAQGILLSAVMLTLLALLPLAGNLRPAVFKAPLAGRIVEGTLKFERPLEGIFGPAAREALGFITVTPPTRPGEAPEQGVKLQFNVSDARAEPQTEEAMLALVNRERTSRGLKALVMDESLRTLARAHGDDMFKRGYFAHETPEGTDPFERMRRANISYLAAGENLALSPTLDIAHDGLMNSPGHRANILNSAFGRVGIGVLDGGMYGKMFVQEFTN